MADIKTSELPSTATTAGILVPVSVPDGGGGYVSRHISYADFTAEVLSINNAKVYTSVLATGENKIIFPGAALSSAAYALNYQCFDSSGNPTPVKLVSKEVDGFTLNNEFGVNLTVNYSAILL